MKKLIAREFLILISTIFLSLIIYGCILLYDLYQNYKSTNAQRKLDNVEKSFEAFMQIPLKNKNAFLTQDKLDEVVNYIIENEDAKRSYIDSVVPELFKDSILSVAFVDYVATTDSKKYRFKKEQNFKFPEFFVVKTADLDSVKSYQLEIQNLLELKSELENENISQPEISRLTFLISLILFCLVFPIRYLYYAVKWSITTLRSDYHSR